MKKINGKTLIILAAIILLGPLFLCPFSKAQAEELSYKDSPRDIVVQMFSTGGIASDIMDKTRVPDFTLYGDGKLIFTRLDSNELVKLYEAKVSPDFIKFLLEYIEKSGFHKMNENYLNLTVQDLPTTYITVNLKNRSKTISVYGLTLAAEQNMIPRGLLNIYRKLSEFQDENEKEYEPKKISLFVYEASKSSIPQDMKIIPWKAKGIDLRKYVNEENSLIIRYKQSVLEGDLMKNAINFLKGKTLYENRAGFLQSFFSNHRHYYKVAYRPHLPYE